ncbi:MAG: hypothetical protein OXT01_23220 [Rhodospirillaceae bacterium]|nr:hypothetical protein [Rhodospirillaceae bacterium]
MSDNAVEIHVRPEFENKNLGKATDVDVERPLSMFERIANINAVRKFSILLGLLFAWEIYTRVSGVEPLLFPSFSESAGALWETILTGEMPTKIWVTIKILLVVYAAVLVFDALLLFL